MAATRDLPARLRSETSGLHQQVEKAVGLPGSLRRVDDYGRLLRCLLAFHQGVEARLEDPGWTADWTAVGIEIRDHRRSPLIVDDLRALDADANADAPAGVPPSGAATALTPLTPGARRTVAQTRLATISLPTFATFGYALGCLYVVEGSSLGGRVLAPAIRAALGTVPLRYFESEGRDHPRPWQRVTEALRRFDPDGATAHQMVSGASTTFAAFGATVASTVWAADAGEGRQSDLPVHSEGRIGASESGRGVNDE